MAKTKISEFSATSADNTDITNINIAEGCSPANVNNAIRSLMSVLKNQQDGSSGDPFTVAGTLVSSGTVDITGAFRLDGTAGASGQVLLSAGGANTPTWGNAFVSGMIMMWSGTIATIPSGWLLCNGSSGTPDLRNRFIIGAFSDDSGTAKTTVTGTSTQTGGSKDLIVPAHTHTSNYSDNTNYLKNVQMSTTTGAGSGANPIAIPEDGTYSDYITSGRNDGGNRWLRFQNSGTTLTTRTLTTDSTGSSATNANLPPYYALAFIMKA
jgi:hypothetical protein